MSTYEYRVVPAPSKGLKAKGIKSHEARFANAIEDLMNTMAASGWEYQRAETLPSVERSGLTGSTTEWRNVLVFRKPRHAEAGDFTSEVLAPPVAGASLVPEVEPDTSEPVAQEAQEVQDTADANAFDHDDDQSGDQGGETDTAQEHPAGQAGATQMLSDNGVEETSDVAGMTDSLRNLAEQRS